MADFSQKLIKDIIVGDKVMGFNENAEFAYKYGYIRANNVTNRLRWLPEWKEFCHIVEEMPMMKEFL